MLIIDVAELTVPFIGVNPPASKLLPDELFALLVFSRFSFFLSALNPSESRSSAGPFRSCAQLPIRANERTERIARCAIEPLNFSLSADGGERYDESEEVRKGGLEVAGGVTESCDETSIGGSGRDFSLNTVGRVGVFSSIPESKEWAR